MFIGCKIPDEILAALIPILVHWLYAGIHILLEPINKYRLHPKKDEDERNLVAKSDVIKMVLLQHIMQASIAILIYKVTDQGKSIEEAEAENQETSIFTIVLQFIVAMIVLDTCQYFIHRYMHYNKFLYQNVHSIHHRLHVPYVYGAFYTHPFEGLLDIVSSALAYLVSGMTPRMSMFFFSFTTIKAMDDHSGLWLPGNIFQVFFYNNSAYHDIHHQLYGNKYNFSQPLFVIWDKVMGTHMPYVLEKRGDGGFEVKPLKNEEKVH